MLFFEVPDYLQIANGLFLVFYALSTIELLFSLSKEKKLMYASLLFTGLITLFIEVIGVNTGFPFGSYQYTDTLGFLVWGVPVTIAFAWVGVIVNSMLLSTQVSKWKRAIETGLWVVVLDLILDPVALERSFWIWDGHGGFYGIPATNFISWFLIGALLSLFFPLFKEKEKMSPYATRLFQAMLAMFGLLAWKAGMPELFFLAFLFILTVEGRNRIDLRRKNRSL